MNEKDNIVLIGASSEISQEFIKLIGEKQNIYKISTSSSYKENNYLHVKDYRDNLDEIISFIQKIDKPYIFFFNGYIAENRPKQNPDIIEIDNTIKINFLVPLAITHALQGVKKDVKKYIYISSFAAAKLRYKNFIYGQSKLLLEQFVENSSIDNFLIIRFGKVNTSMSSEHKKTVFDMSKVKAANILEKYYKKKSGIVYPTTLIKVLSIAIKILPSKILKKLKI